MAAPYLKKNISVRDGHNISYNNHFGSQKNIVVGVGKQMYRVSDGVDDQITLFSYVAVHLAMES